MPDTRPEHKSEHGVVPVCPPFKVSNVRVSNVTPASPSEPDPRLIEANAEETSNQDEKCAEQPEECHRPSLVSRFVMIDRESHERRKRGY
jgi:hypothetical protein